MDTNGRTVLRPGPTCTNRMDRRQRDPQTTARNDIKLFFGY